MHRPTLSTALAAAATSILLALPVSAQVWEETDPVPTGGAARLYAIGLSEGGEVLAMAGSPYDGGPTGDSRVDAWTASGGWVQHAPFEGPIIGQGIGVDALGRIVVFGGWDGPDPEGDLGITFVYDRQEGKDLELADRSSAAPVHGVAFATDDQHRIYSIGGDFYSSHVERYDGLADAWSVVAPLPTGRRDAVAVNDGRGHLLVIGGRVSGGAASSQVLRYDPATNTWEAGAVAPLPYPLYDARAAVGADGRVYVVGGVSSAGVPEAGTLVLDLDANAWSAGPTMAVPRRSFGLVLGPDDFLYAIGGDDGAGGTNRVERLFTSPCALAGAVPASVEPWEGLSFTLHAFFAGASPITYQWEKDGVPLADGPSAGGGVVSGAQTDTLHVSGVGAADSGAYRLVGTNTCGSDATDAVAVTVAPPPALGPWRSVRRMAPFGTGSVTAAAIDGTRLFGNGLGVQTQWGPQSQGVAWNAAGEVAQTFTPGNSVGSGVSDSAGGRAVGWWWWPYTTPQGTGYYQHAATWDPATGQLVDVQPSGWEIGSIAATNGTQHVGTIRRTDESTTVDAAYWASSVKSAVLLTPSVAWGSGGSDMDGPYQYGWSNMGFGVVHASRWRGSAATWEDWHPSGASRSYLDRAADGIVVGRAYFGSAATTLVWGDQPGDWNVFLPAGADAASLVDTDGGYLVGSVTPTGGTAHAALWAGPAGSTVDLGALASALGLQSATAKRVVAQDGHVRVLGQALDPVAGRTEAVVWSFQDQPLVAAPDTVSLAAGGRHELYLAAGEERAGHVYFVVGSATGTDPGVPLGGGFVAPIVPDPYTEWTLVAFNGALLRGTVGVLDALGGAQAALDLPDGLQPSLAGTTLHHAYLCFGAGGALSFVSNATSVELVP